MHIAYELPLRLLVLAFAASLALAKVHAEPATYSNPILTENNPADPDVLPYDGKYYMCATSHGKGYDVYVSNDLVHWENKGLAFDDPRGGVWAPDLFHYESGDGKVYLFYTDNHDSEPRTAPSRKQIGVAVADGPLGPFKDLHVLVTDAIDAHLFEDTDGKLYLYYADIEHGFKIMGQAMEDPGTASGEPVELLRPTEPWEKRSGDVTEGPFVLKRGETYYLMYSGTGANSPNYAIGYATAASPLGPFAKYPKNPIVQRNDQVLGPGHHCVVTGPRGDLWMLYHQKWDTKTNFNRFLALDKVWFDDEGILHARVTKDTPEAAP